jgi:hypothetical protein
VRLFNRTTRSVSLTDAGRRLLNDLGIALPPALKYESDVVMAEDDLVMLHGRFSGTGMISAPAATSSIRPDTTNHCLTLPCQPLKMTAESRI